MMTRLAILVSGRGSNLRAIMRACSEGTLRAEVALVISNNADSMALETARTAGINTAHLSRQQFSDEAELDQAMLHAIEEANVNYVLLAGFMKKIGPRVLAAYKGRIINIHPSLLPSFGGKGMFGLNVHKAVIKAGETQTGVTIHLVDEEYDQGQILAQRTVEVKTDDTPESLAARVLIEEHQIFAETIQKIIDGSIILPGQ